MLIARLAIMRLFSAHAEVFPLILRLPVPSSALLRARGGISIVRTGRAMIELSSPRTRRYFLDPFDVYFTYKLFSAHAEVFPIR